MLNGKRSRKVKNKVGSAGGLANHHDGTRVEKGTWSGIDQ